MSSVIEDDEDWIDVENDDGSCPECGAAAEEDCEPWCSQGLDEDDDEDPDAI